MRKICVKCGREEDCEITLASIRVLLSLMQARHLEADNYSILVPDWAVPYIMALAGRGLWAELRARAELC